MDDTAPPTSQIPRPATPPQDLKAEQALLGAMLLSTDAIAETVELLEPADFYRPTHEHIYLIILDLYADEQPVDAITVTAELRKRKSKKPADPGYLHTLANSAARPSAYTKLAQRIRNAAVLRRLWGVAHDTGVLAVTTPLEHAEDALTRAQSDMLAIRSRPTTAPPDDSLFLSDIMEGALDEFEAIDSREGWIGVPTGFTDLDLLTNGLRPGQLIVIASRPAVGKSTLALDIVRTCSIRDNRPAVLFSLEAGNKEIATRITSAECHVALHHLRGGGMTDDDWTRLARRMPNITRAPLLIDDSPRLTMSEIYAKSRRLRAHHKIELIAIDPLHLLPYGTRPFASRYEEVNEISRMLKSMAKDLQIPVIAVSELNRGPETRTDRKPLIHDLRDSGTLEENADLVILLHREDAYEKESPRAGEADLIVAKHRSGPTATITVAFQGHYARFVDFARPPTCTGDTEEKSSPDSTTAPDTGV
ncbi:replicative DNA helicase [Streptomyces sp. NPDC018031]|uniref:replicative DNA helicase n=1 Tax=Streptomyces sp. NPDC018031 TaxID=3365033 RepID=UPI00379A4CF3